MVEPAAAPGADAASLPAPAWSLQRRLRLQLLALLSVLWLAGSAASALSMWSSTSDVLDGAMNEAAEHLLMLPDAVLDAHDSNERAIQFGPHSDYMVYQVSDAQGRIRLRSHHAPLAPLDPGAPTGVRTAGGWQVLTLGTADGARVAQVAEPLEHRRAVLWSSLAWQLAALGALLPVAALATGYLLRRGFASLEAARGQLAGRDAERLDPLDTTGAPAELLPWLQTVNRLLQRVRARIEAERSFAAHTAHELRTPLAAARAQAQWLLLQMRAAQPLADGPPPAEAATALVRQLDRLTVLATRLLELARVEAGLALQREAVDVVAVAQVVGDDFPEARRRGRLHLPPSDPPLVVEGDMDAIGIALRNLIDNALKHGGEQARVRVWVAGRALHVEDDGPGVDPAQLPTLVLRHVRADTAAGAGNGLGLAMVDTIARQSGARLNLRSPMAGGRGLRATLDFAPGPQAG